MIETVLSTRKHCKWEKEVVNKPNNDNKIIVLPRKENWLGPRVL